MLLPLLTHHQALNLIGDCWTVFMVVWLIGALRAKRTEERWSAATGVAYFLAMALMYTLLVRSEYLGGTLLVGHGPTPSLVASLICASGLAITVWARVVLGRNWSGSITYKQDHELVERGPYRWVRHPIYTGLLLMVAGTAVARGTADAFAAIVLFVAVHLWKLRQEEALMTRHFPEAYPDYRARTKALIPFLY
jgi:protein-S-isoprenylcysteine O-methyltransferase Ste14